MRTKVLSRWGGGRIKEGFYRVVTGVGAGEAVGILLPLGDP